MSGQNNNIEKIYPLTPMQEGMLFHSIKDDSKAYFTQLFYHTEGELDLAVFSRSIDYLSKRHDIFRTAFVHGKTEKPVQVVLKDRRIALTVEDQSELSAEEYQSYLSNYKDQDIAEGFDLLNKPLIRLSIFKRNEQSFDFLWSYHHLLMDGWCHAILIDELGKIYAGLKHNQTIDLSSSVDFESYVQWLGKKNRKTSQNYWEKYLKSYNHIAEIPHVGGWDGSDVAFLKREITLDQATTQLLKEVGKEQNVTLNEIFQGLWGLLLAKYSHSNDVVYGNVVSGRPAELEGMDRCMGLFINTIPIRLQIQQNDTLVSLVKRIHDDFIESIPHHYNSLADIQNGTEVKADLIKHVVAFENYPIKPEDEKTEGFQKISGVDVYEKTNYSLDLDVEITDEIRVTFYFNPSDYHPDYIEKILSSLSFLADQFIVNPTIDISDLGFVNQEDTRQLLQDFNPQAVDLGNDQPINSRFEEQVRYHGEAIAVLHRKEIWNYQQLNDKANQIANLMISNGLQKGEFVGLMMDRSPLLIASLLAIFKAGGVYVPLDTQNPALRNRELIMDSKITTLLSDRKALLKLKDETTGVNSLNHIISLDNLQVDEIRNWGITISDLIDINNSEKNNPVNINSMTDWAYMLFTSGSTGKPKGAIIKYDGAMNHILAEFRELDLPDGFRFLQSASIASDVSVWQILAPLLKGGTCVILDKNELLTYDHIVPFLNEHLIHIAEFAPSYLYELIEYLKNNGDQVIEIPELKWVMLTGEEAPVSLVKDWFSLFPTTKLVNGYGPCEASDDVTQFIIEKPLSDQETKVSIGKPIANMNIFIVDENEKLVPVGVPGEICVAGIGVGAGYFGEPEKTAKSFKKNPFSGTLGNIMYKTGDLGRWMPDGNLEFLGRVDRQVKIRGNRVELGEIESFIKATDLVQNIHIASCKNINDVTELVAFVVVDNEEVVGQLIKKCKQGLPFYMQPAEYIKVDHIPLNLSDKVDEKKLLASYNPQESVQNQKAIKACNSETEKVVKNIWEQVLNKTGIGLNDQFFELGGHSLLAMRVRAAIQKQMGIQIDIRDLFTYTHLDQLAAFLDEKTKRDEFETFIIQNKKDKSPLSYAQERLWFIDQLQGSVDYHISAALNFKGILDVKALNDSLKEIVDRHEILKSIVINDQGSAYQELITDREWKLDLIDQEKELKSEELTTIISDLVTEPFDLSNAFKFRATLIKKSSNAFVLVLVMHHIAADGWSESILVDELMKLYAAKIKGEEAILPKLPIQYTDFALWQQNDKENIEAQVDYWKNQLADLSILELPTDRERPKVLSTKGAAVEHVIDPKTVKGLKKLAAKQGTTFFMTLLAAFKILVYKYSGQTDVCIGTPVAGRSFQEFEGLIGYFVNTLAIRSKLDPLQDFNQLLKSVKETTLDAYKYQDAPIEKIVDAILEERDMSRNPLYQVMFTLQNTPEVQDLALGELTIDYVDQEEILTPFDIHFNIEEDPERGAVLLAEYSTSLFDHSTIERMVMHYQTLLEAILNSQNEKIQSLDFVTDQEKKVIINEFAGSSTKLTSKQTVPHLFEESVNKYPDHLAIKDETHGLTYSELNAQANQLANHIIENYHLSADETIGVIMHRGTQFVVTMLAILKTGASYLPIDVKNVPADRINQLLEQVEAKLFITDDSHQLNTIGTNFDGIDLSNTDLTNESSLTPDLNKVTTNSLAYIMFTSGTTGKPKGAMVNHESIVRLVKNTNYTEITVNDRILQTGSLSFDAATFEIWGALLNGAQVHVMKLRDLLDVESLGKAISEREITKLFITTSWFNQIIDINEGIFKPLNQVLFGGEKVSYYHVEKVKRTCPDLRLTHCYGPTENTTFSICGDIPNVYEHIPLGTPISNSTVYILDQNQNILPKGIHGEILLGGLGLSRGYVNDTERTREKFIPHPFIENEFLYKSGDVGKWMDDGQIEFVGRVDDQVKINGFRIEPSEITNTLRLHDQIVEAVVIVFKKENGDKALAGYFVGKQQLKENEIRIYLEKVLPIYMVPVFICQVDQIPLNQNGKVDKKRLPSPEVLIGDHEGPEGEMEEKVTAVWSELLGINQHEVSVTANFFSLGGHSLLAMKVIAKLQQVTGISMDVGIIFNFSTIRQLAAELERIAGAKDVSEIPTLQPQALYEVSQAQKRVWIANQVAQEKGLYNISNGFEIEGELNIASFEMAIQKVLERHEILRTNFVEKEGIPFQLINPFKAEHVDFKIIQAKDIVGDARMVLASEESYDFNLAKEALIRFRLLTDGIRNFLIVNMHHIIGDGWSALVLQNDLLNFYYQLIDGNQTTLTPLSIQYKEYATWHNNLLKETDQESANYWSDTLKGISSRPDLPTDKVRSSVSGIVSKNRSFTFDKEITSKIEELTKQKGIGQFVILQALTKVFLSGYLSSSDIVIGTPAAGRGHHQLEDQIGFYVNMLALRSNVDSEATLNDLLEQVSTETANAFQHQHYPYDFIVNDLKIKREVNRNQLFDVVIYYMDGLEDKVEGRLSFKELTEVNETEKYDLAFTYQTNELGDLTAVITYNSNLFFDSSMISLQEQLADLFKDLLKTPERPLIEHLASKEEAMDLVDDFS